MVTVKPGDTGPAVEDVQGKFIALGLLPPEGRTGSFDDATARALRSFCRERGLPEVAAIDDKTWAALLDSSFHLGDRTLYLRMPYFHGNDVRELQRALGTLGFDCGSADGIFGAHTEAAVRKFQLNLGLYSDGIVGAATYAALNNLKFSWAGKSPLRDSRYLGFARAADVLESHTLCLFGTEEFTRSVASRMSNLALATNPHSKIMSADSLLVAPGDDMLMVHIVLPGGEGEGIPVVQYGDGGETLPLRLHSAIEAANPAAPRIAVVLPGTQWELAGTGRSAQHYAITLLDALCVSLLP